MKAILVGLVALGAFLALGVSACDHEGYGGGAVGYQGSEMRDQPTPVSVESAAPSGDEIFLKVAANANMAEMQLAKLALQNSSSEAVQRYAHHMLQEHSTAQRQVETLLSRRGAAMPTALDPIHEAVEQRLSSLSGPAFDEEYARCMQKDHQKALIDFQDAARNAMDPDVRNFASEMLPHLQQHLALADQLDRGPEMGPRTASSAKVPADVRNAPNTTNGPIPTRSDRGMSPR